MRQAVNYKMTVSFDVVMQDVPDDATHEDVIKYLEDIKNSLERQVAHALCEDVHYFNTKVYLTQLPKIE